MTKFPAKYKTVSIALKKMYVFSAERVLMEIHKVLFAMLYAQLAIVMNV